MADTAKLNLLDEELDEASQKYIQESLEAWKESVTNQLVEQMEREKQAKIEELEEENAAYREQLKEEFTEKMLDGLNELKESIRAEVTAEVIKNNPELKIFEQVKEIVAPLVSENYRDNAYEDTISKLSEEVETLRREQEIQEGAKTLASLLAPYSEKTQKLILSLIKEGSPDEVTEQFYNIYESLANVFEADEGTSDDASSDDSSDASSDEGSSDDASSDDSSDASSDDSSDASSDDSSEEETNTEGTKDESFITEGVSGLDQRKTDNKYNLKNILKSYSL
jgi:5-formyltetrahydrofolate cyclo-ligase